MCYYKSFVLSVAFTTLTFHKVV